MSNEEFNKKFKKFVRDSVQNKKIKGLDLISDIKPPEFSNINFDVNIEVKRKKNESVNVLNTNTKKSESTLF